VALDEVPETGRHFELIADGRVRAALAELAGLRSLPRLQAMFDLTRHGRDGLRVVGQVSATVGQVCGVTLEPLDNEVEEPIDLVFTPQPAAVAARREETGERKRQVEVTAEDAPEPLIDGTVDLGAIATEFLMLGIDPYPRKPDAVFEPPAADRDTGHPFAALAALKKGNGGQ
jgi:hypothetical protein